MKIDYCKLAQDIMPLYIDNLVSGETKEFMHWHLSNCPECTNLYEVSQLSDIPPIPVENIGDKFQSAKSFLLRIKKTLLASIAVVVFLIFIFTAGGFWFGSKSNNDLLSLQEVTDTLKQQEIHLAKDTQKSPADFVYQGIKPVIYKMDQLKGKMFIYIFDSYKDRQNAYSHGNGEKLHKLFTQDEPVFFYEARNVLLVVNVPHEAMKPTPEVQETFNSIKNVVFKNLNDGKELIFKGEGDSWEGKVTIKYYEHWWKDDKGVMQYESYHTGQPILKYKGNDLEYVGKFKYRYEFPSESSEGSGMRLDINGYMINGGNTGGNGTMPREDDIGSMTVEWNGRQETFELQANKYSRI